MPNNLIRLSVTDDIVSWFDQTGPILFYAAVFGLVFAGTGLFVGAFIPFITGDSLVFAAGLVAAANQDSINIFVMVVGVGIAAWLGDQVGYTLGRHYGRPYLDKRKGKWLKNDAEVKEAQKNVLPTAMHLGCTTRTLGDNKLNFMRQTSHNCLKMEMDLTVTKH